MNFSLTKVCAVLAGATLLSSSAFGGGWDGVRLVGTTDRSPVSYSVREPIVFNFTLDGQVPAGEWSVAWTSEGDDGVKTNGCARLEKGTASVCVSLAKPGFVRFCASVVDADGKRPSGCAATFDGGAGAEIEKLETVAEPKDFDAFWTKQRQRLDEVPVKATVREVLSMHPDKVRSFAVEVACAGPRPVTGYLSVPVQCFRGVKVPALLRLDGAGCGGPYFDAEGPDDRLWFHVNAHGYELDRDKAYYDEFRRSIRSGNSEYAFDPVQNSSPENAYFRWMAVRVMRALDYLKTRPEWNGRDLWTSGGSQGALQATWGAALDPDVTRAELTVTWCCDLAGKEEGRVRGGWHIPYVPALGYFDAVNHAKRIRPTCTVDILRAGLGDYVSPPSGLACLYNAMKCPKSIRWVQGSTHGGVPKDAQVETRVSKPLPATAGPALVLRHFKGAVDWSQVAPVKLMRTDGSEEPAAVPVEAKLVYTDGGLCGRIVQRGKPTADAAKGLWKNDTVEVLALPGTMRDVLHHFAYDPCGNTFGVRARRHPIPGPEESWKPAAVVSNSVDETAWTSTFFIPFDDFTVGPGERPAPGVRWHLNLVVTKLGERVQRLGNAMTCGDSRNVRLYAAIAFTEDRWTPPAATEKKTTAPADGERLRLGVLSDVHLAGARDVALLKKALRRFRDEKVAGVVIAGDIADSGFVEELTLCAEAWRTVFPNDRGADGQKVEKLFIYGNHDIDRWTWQKKPDELKDPAYRARSIGADENRGKMWERAFGEPYAPVWMKDVAGYKVIGVHWGCCANLADFLAAHDDELKGAKPFFVITHPHPKNTCLGPWAWGAEKDGITEALAKYPNAVSISGHSHTPLSDERSVWRGAFTAINASSLGSAIGDYNLRDNAGGNLFGYTGLARKKLSPRFIASDAHEGILLSLTDESLRLKRINFTYAEDVGSDWIVPLDPVKGREAMGVAQRRARRSAPVFTAEASVAVSRPSPDRLWVAFPAAKTVGESSVCEYEVTGVLVEDGVELPLVTKRLFAPDHFLPESRKGEGCACVFAADDFPPNGHIRFDVRPLESLGNAGRVISSEPICVTK